MPRAARAKTTIAAPWKQELFDYTTEHACRLYSQEIDQGEVSWDEDLKICIHEIAGEDLSEQQCSLASQDLGFSDHLNHHKNYTWDTENSVCVFEYEGSDSEHHPCDDDVKAVEGSPDVFVNNRRSHREGDRTNDHIYSVDGDGNCTLNHTVALREGSPNVFVNDKAFGRAGDTYEDHMPILNDTASPDVYINANSQDIINLQIAAARSNGMSSNPGYRANVPACGTKELGVNAYIKIPANFPCGAPSCDLKSSVSKKQRDALAEKFWVKLNKQINWVGATRWATAPTTREAIAKELMTWNIPDPWHKITDYSNYVDPDATNVSTMTKENSDYFISYLMSYKGHLDEGPVFGIDYSWSYKNINKHKAEYKEYIKKELIEYANIEELNHAIDKIIPLRQGKKIDVIVRSETTRKEELVGHTSATFTSLFDPISKERVLLDKGFFDFSIKYKSNGRVLYSEKNAYMEPDETCQTNNDMAEVGKTAPQDVYHYETDSHIAGPMSQTSGWNQCSVGGNDISQVIPFIVWFSSPDIVGCRRNLTEVNSDPDKFFIEVTAIKDYRGFEISFDGALFNWTRFKLAGTKVFRSSTVRGDIMMGPWVSADSTGLGRHFILDNYKPDASGNKYEPKTYPIENMGGLLGGWYESKNSAEIMKPQYELLATLFHELGAHAAVPDYWGAGDSGLFTEDEMAELIFHFRNYDLEGETIRGNKAVKRSKWPSTCSAGDYTFLESEYGFCTSATVEYMGTTTVKQLDHDNWADCHADNGRWWHGCVDSGMCSNWDPDTPFDVLTKGRVGQDECVYYGGTWDPDHYPGKVYTEGIKFFDPAVEGNQVLDNIKIALAGGYSKYYPLGGDLSPSYTVPFKGIRDAYVYSNQVGWNDRYEFDLAIAMMKQSTDLTGGTFTSSIDMIEDEMMARILPLILLNKCYTFTGDIYPIFNSIGIMLKYETCVKVDKDILYNKLQGSLKYRKIPTKEEIQSKMPNVTFAP